MLFATDGLHELRNQSDEDFSWDRLGELWSECAQKSADESLDYLYEGAKSFANGSGPQDDLTAIALRVPVEIAKVGCSPSGAAALENDFESSAELPVCAAISL